MKLQEKKSLQKLVRAGDPSRLVASSDKVKATLGWEPEYTDIKTIIKTAWNWHVSHPHGYED